MSTRAIISYDDTPNDHDALMLGRVLAAAGAELTLAYVRHSKEAERSRERLEEHEAYALLERGARSLGDPDAELGVGDPDAELGAPDTDAERGVRSLGDADAELGAPGVGDADVARRVVLSGSTAEGLRRLAEEEGADVIVFGSDYRTAAGHVSPQRSAQALLERGRTAVAIAPANYRGEHATTFGRVGVLASPGDDAAIETARELAESYGARVTRDEPYVDLLVVGSRPEAPAGEVMLSAQAQKQIENAGSPVLVVPRGVTVRFPLVAAAA